MGHCHFVLLLCRLQFNNSSFFYRLLFGGQINVLGKVRGAIGNIVGRVRSGKNYLSSKPSSFIPGSDPGSLNRRGKFKISVLFAKAVVNVKDLKTIWDINSPNGLSAYNFVVSVNYKYFENNIPSSSNTITPLNGFIITSGNFQVDASGIQLEIDRLGDIAPFDPAIEKNIRLYSVTLFYNPVDSKNDEIGFISAESAKQIFKTADALNFSISFAPYRQALFSRYQNQKTFCAILILDENDQPVRHSLSISN